MTPSTPTPPFAADDLDRLQYVAGSWDGSMADEWIDVHAPSRRGLVIARVPRSGPSDVDRAVSTARAVQPAWAALPFAQRQRALLRIADDLEEAAEELAVLTAWDTGNALRPQARPEVATLVALFRYFAGVAGEFKGEVLPAGAGQLQYTRREPWGVVAGILPWNSPLMIAGMKVPAALVAGNAMILKAAEAAPLTILRLVEIAEPHLPAGLLSVLTGYGDEVGEALVRHPWVNKVSFTGSSKIGHHVAGIAGSRLAPVSLELGGKSPTIVFPSAASDELIERTATGVLTGMRFTRQGQSCTAGSRLFVHHDIQDKFLAELSRQVGNLVIGDPLDEATDMGAIINDKQFAQVRGYLDEAQAQPGIATVLDRFGETPEGLDGLYCGPVILSGVDNSWRIAQEEIFGPVLVAIGWSDREEVIRMANNSHYGLAAYVWSQDLTEALDTAHRIDSGWIQVNQGGGQQVGQSYGGYKTSGLGREFSLEGAIEGFTQLKQINVNLT